MITGTTSLAQLAASTTSASPRREKLPLHDDSGLTLSGTVAVGVGAAVGGAIGLGVGSFAAFGLALAGASPWKSNAAAIGGALIGAALVGAGTYGLARLAD